MGASLFLIGLGDLGGVILELLAREEGIGRIVVGSQYVEQSEVRCNLARLGAMAQGHAPDIHFVPLDLNQIEETAEAISKVSPAIVLSTASLMTWWLPNLFPPQQRTELRQAGFGAWLPVHLVLPIKLMRALQLADYQGYSLIASYPDVVNPVLKALGLTPSAGVGNLSEIIPKIQLLGSKKLGVEPSNLRVTMVAHHALEAWVFGGKEGQPPPYYLRVDFEGKDITEGVAAYEWLFAPYPIPDGPLWHFLTAGSTVRLVRALLSDREIHLHVPGIHGMPGGYPVIASKHELALALPPDLTLAQARKINEDSHRFDGIERIEEDGSVVFCPQTVEIMHDLLGYECEQLKPEEAETRAIELIERFRAFAAQHGVQITSTGR